MNGLPVHAKGNFSSFLRQAGGIGVLVDILHQSPQNNTLLANSVKVIRHLSNDSPATRKSIRQCGGVEPLVRLMQLGEDSPVAIDSIAALGYLVHKDASTKATVRRLGGIPLLVRMLHAGEMILWRLKGTHVIKYS